MEIPFLHNKYLNHYTDLSQVKTSLEFELRKTLVKNANITAERQTQKSTPKNLLVSIKTSEKMRVYLDADEDIINIEAKIKFIDMMLNYLDNVY